MIDNQPAGAGVEAPAIVEAPEAVAETPASETAQAEPDKGGDDESRKIQNALQRKERRIGQLTAQKYQFQRELEQARAELEKYKAPKAQQATELAQPQPEQFATPAEYHKAHAKWVDDVIDSKVSQGLTKEQQKSNETRQQAEKLAWREERGQHLQENSAQATKAFPDFKGVVEQYSDVLQALPQEIIDVALDFDHPGFALYELCQDGSIEQLLQASPTKASAMIAKAEERALAKSKSKPVTKAPSPMTPAKGTATGRKSLNDMSPKELVDWVHSKS